MRRDTIVITLLTFVAFAAALPGSGPTAAEPAAEAAAVGLIDASAIREIVPGHPIIIRRPDRSALSGDVAALFERALGERGGANATAEAHVLSFRLESDPSADVPRPPNLELRGSYGSASDDDLGLLMRLQVLDGRAPRPEGEARVLRVSLSDERNRLLWRASAQAAGPMDDAYAFAKALVPHLVARIGHDSYRESVP